MTSENDKPFDNLKENLMPQLKAFFIDNKEGEHLRSTLFDLFSKCPHPYHFALDLTEKAPDYLQPKSNSLSSTIFRQFAKWHKNVWKDDVAKKKLLTLDVRRRAFDVCSRRHTHLLSDGVNIFDLEDLGEIFIPDIKRKICLGFYKEAAVCVIALKLQNFFGLKEILVPCLLQDKNNFVEPYLDGHPDLQKEFAEMLDKLCTADADIRGFLSNYNVTGVRRDKLALKPIQKLIARLTKRFSIPTELTPNFTRTRSEGSMRYLLVRRYTEKSIDVQTFDDMVYHSVKSCPHLDLYLLQLLCLLYNDLPEALKWAYRLRVPAEEWPTRLRAFAKTNPRILISKLGDASEDEADNSVDDDYLKLPIPLGHVHMVDNERDLECAVERIVKEDIIGLDTEWQPNFGQPFERVAILQVALKDCIFLMDLMTLLTNTSEKKIRDAMGRIFANKKPLKLGFQFAGDTRTLALTLPFCNDIFSNMKNMLCLGSLIDQLRRVNKSFMPSPALVSNGKASTSSNDQTPNETKCEEASIISEKLDQILSLGLDESIIRFDCSLLDMDDEHIDKNAINDEGQADAAYPSEFSIGDTVNQTSKKPQIGLSEACLYFLSKPLNKNMQISNWCRRPLRTNQILYAALDAYCLLPLYEKVVKKAQELGIDLAKISHNSLISGSSEVDARFKVKKDRSWRNIHRDKLWTVLQEIENKQSSAEAGNPKGVRDLKVIVDNMLGGLGKQLRRCGIDCKLMDNGECRQMLMKVAQEENRLILSSGSAFDEIAKCVPTDQCCRVDNMLNSKEQLASFITQQNVRITEDDIFSRCVMCNNSDFVVIPSPIFRTLWDNKMAPDDFLDPAPFDREVALQRIETCIKECKQLPISFKAEFCADSWTYTTDRFSINVLNGKIVALTASESCLNSSSTYKIEKSAVAQIEHVPNSSIFDSMHWFYVCVSCGKVYWDGAHMKRYLNNIGMTFEPGESHRFLR